MMELLILLATYSLAFVAVFFSVYRWLPLGRENPTPLAALSVGLGPTLIAWVLNHLLWVAPGQHHLFYLSVTLAPFVLLTWLNRSSAPALKHELHQCAKGVGRVFRFSNGLFSGLALIIGLFSCAIIYRAVGFPVFENDPLDYLNMARLVFEQLTVANYPFINAETHQGFYNATAHPLAYASTMVWGFLIQGHSESLWLAKLISPFYAISLILALAVLPLRTGKLSRLFSVIFLISVPIFAWCSGQRQIDAIRIYLFALPLLLLPDFLANRTRANMVALGVLSGLALYGHSAGLLIFPTVGFVVLFLPEGRLWDRLRFSVPAALLAIPVGGWQYFKNFSIFGSPTNYALPTYAYEHLRMVATFRAFSGNESTAGRLVNGVFGGFTWQDAYGLSFWVFTAATLLLLPRVKRNSAALCCLLAVLALQLQSLIVTMLGEDAFIMNRRYIMMFLPLMAYPVGLAGAKLWRTLESNLRNRYLLGATQAALLVLVAYSSLSTAKNEIVYVERVFRLGSHNRWAPDSQNVLRFPDIGEVIGKIKDTVKDGELVFSQQYNRILFHLRTPVLRDHDPRAIGVYTAKTPREVWEELKRLGVDYIHTVGDARPHAENSQLGKMMRDPQYTEVIISRSGFVFYRLRQTPVTDYTLKKVALDAAEDWKVNLGSVTPENWMGENTQGGEFRKEGNGFQFWLATDERGALPFVHTTPWGWICKTKRRLEKDADYLLKAKIRGEGQFNISLSEIWPGGPTKLHQKTSMEATASGKEVSIRFRTTEGACDFYALVLLIGPGEITLDNMELFQVVYGKEPTRMSSRL